MKDEIKELVVDNGELIVYYKDGSFQSFDTLSQEVLDYITNLQQKIEKALEIIDSYELGKYDYSIPPIGIIELKDALKGSDKK